MKKLLSILIVFFLLGCGSTKTVTKKDTEGKEDVTIVDNTTKVSDISSEQQFLSTETKERIVTLYSVRFDTIYVDGERTILPIVFPTQTEEFRDINTSNYVWKIKMQDSIKNAIEIKYKTELKEKDEKIKQHKESKSLLSLILLYVIFMVGILFVIIKL